MRTVVFRAALAAGILALAAAFPSAVAQESYLSQWLTHLEKRLPRTAPECGTNKAGPVEEAAEAVEPLGGRAGVFPRHRPGRSNHLARG